MARIDVAHLWSLSYRLVGTVIAEVSPAIAELGLEVKELFVLAEIEAHPYPADLAAKLCIPKPTVSAYLKHLEAEGWLRREIDRADLRRHRLVLTASGRKTAQRGVELLSEELGARLAHLSTAEQAELARLLGLLDTVRDR